MTSPTSTPMPETPDEPRWRRLAREANERRQQHQDQAMDMSLTTSVRDDNRKPDKEQPR